MLGHETAAAGALPQLASNPINRLSTAQGLASHAIPYLQNTVNVIALNPTLNGTGQSPLPLIVLAPSETAQSFNTRHTPLVWFEPNIERRQVSGQVFSKLQKPEVCVF